ncbi:hypothetical protein SELMODRAFT_64232, partial [Selaginella moellendorffii]
RLLSNPRDELQRFRLSLLWIGLDQSTPVRIAFSWIIFLLFAIVLPVINSVATSCSRCYHRQLPFERLVYVSESALAIVSFACLSFLLRRHGLRKVLMLEKLDRESQEVQQNYRAKVNFAFRLLAMIILPSMVVKLVREIWWFSRATVALPGIPHGPALRSVMCTLVMLSWLYKAGVFLLMCVLFRLMCSLQILRLQGYSTLLAKSLDVPELLLEHVRIRKQLFKISHRCRIFILASMFIITSSQFISLFFILSYKESVHFFIAGSLAVSSAVQLSGILTCMNGASKITHRAQKLISLVSEWHAVWTCSAMTSDFNKPAFKTATPPCYPLLRQQSDIKACDLFSAKSQDSHYDNECYFRQQQSFLRYLQHNSPGISVYGFVLDRGSLYTLFALELSLVLWILGKTV